MGFEVARQLALRLQIHVQMVTPAHAVKQKYQQRMRRLGLLHQINQVRARPPVDGVAVHVVQLHFRSRLQAGRDAARGYEIILRLVVGREAANLPVVAGVAKVRVVLPSMAVSSVLLARFHRRPRAGDRGLGVRGWPARE